MSVISKGSFSCTKISYRQHLIENEKIGETSAAIANPKRMLMPDDKLITGIKAEVSCLANYKISLAGDFISAWE